MATLKAAALDRMKVPAEKLMDEAADKYYTASASLLEEAHTIIHGDRERTYGDPGKNLRNIAAYWSVHLSATTGQNIVLTPQDVCGMMILLKQARLANSPTHRDSLVDIAGYAALQDVCNTSA